MGFLKGHFKNKSFSVNTNRWHSPLELSSSTFKALTMSLNHHAFCRWEFMTLTVLDSEMKERGVAGYESKSHRTERKRNRETSRCRQTCVKC